ncbi:MAG: glycosyltransferase family 2 protein [Pseudomonadota bacterium]
MYSGNQVSTIVPARNEGLNIECVVRGLRRLRNETGDSLIDEIIVCDNGSTDDTAAIANRCGAKVIYQRKPGYGAACLSAVSAASVCDIYLFVDGDDSIDYDDVFNLLAPFNNGADLVIGTRKPHLREQGAMSIPQLFGNAIAVRMIKLLWNEDVTDLGPFRAIRAPAYHRLSMQDHAFGWTVEMQVKAIQLGLTVNEVAVSCKRRRGVSKIGGSITGVLGAARGILGTIFALWLHEKFARFVTKNETSG